MKHERKTNTAYRVKNAKEWTWSQHRISKCWKDQLGKGRNKRTSQYRPVAA